MVGLHMSDDEVGLNLSMRGELLGEVTLRRASMLLLLTASALSLICFACGSESGSKIVAGDAFRWGPGHPRQNQDGGGQLMNDSALPDGLGGSETSDDGVALNDLAQTGDGALPDLSADGFQQGLDVGDDQAMEEVIEVPIEDVECHFIPEVGVFSPVLECFWDDPEEKVNFNDVVMAPVVANLTDDNHDGVVDLKDTPDVAFLTYRREEDGCCNSPSVLRVVSGSCQGALEVQGGDEARLHEHFYIASPTMDNSSGLAIGDIDNDGKPEIVAMKVGGGTVAYSEVRYDSFPPTVLGASEWTLVGAVDEVTALSGADEFDAAGVTSSTASSRILLDWKFVGEGAIAIPAVKVIVYARVQGNPAALRAVLVSGSKEALSDPVEMLPAQGWQRLVFQFTRNPLSSDKLWKAANLAALQVGIEHSGPTGVQLDVSKLDVVVGWLAEEWQSVHPKGADILTAVQPAIADLDKDGKAEVVVGRVVLNGADGTKLWKGTAGLGTNSFFGPIGSAADLDLDGQLEVFAGNSMYSAAGETLWSYDYGSDGSGCNAQGYPCDGFNATGNFDDDDFGELAVIRRGVLYILEHSGELLARIVLPGDNCSYNEGGPPTVADFDGDEFPEVGVAGADFYVVFDLECCAALPQCTEVKADAPQCAGPGIRWQVPNFDCSSRVTGSSVFDFEGDGQAEVIYNDEQLFRIFRGTDGEILFEEGNLSHTRLEYPLVADTDNDGNAEIVIVENGKSGYDHIPIQIWGDAQNRWVPTRRIWNQHTYHITNITEVGLLPEGGEEPNWLVYNNYRQNLPDFEPFLAPDLQVEMLAPENENCGSSVTLKAKVCNLGELWVPPGVSVLFFDGATQLPLECQESSTAVKVQLEPGQCVVSHCTTGWAGGPGETKVVRICVDGFDYSCMGPGIYNECDEANNAEDQYLTTCLL
jgi:hypothetical protein